jgi:hypothetical protein
MPNSTSPVCAGLCAAVNSEAIVCHDGFDACVWRRHAPRHRAAARLEFARRRLCGSERFFGGRDAHDSRGAASFAASTSTTTSAPVTTSSTSAMTTSSTGETGFDAGDAASPLVVVAIDFTAGFILIRNDGDEDYDLAGHWICNRPTYSQLPDEVLAPGDAVEIEASAVGLNADGGELALYTSGDFSSAEDIIRYVQRGTDTHGRTATAIAGGVWQTGDFVDNQGANLDSVGSDPVSAADWSST